MHLFIAIAIALSPGTGEDRGASGVEYGILLVAVSAAIAASIFAIGSKVGVGLSDFNSLLP